MPKVKKDNKIYNVADASVNGYLKRGFDLIGDKGEIIKPATGGKTVNLQQFNEVSAENQSLKAEIETLKGQSPSEVESLKAEFDTLQEAHQALAQERDDLKLKGDDLQAQNADLQKQIDDLKAKKAAK